MNTFSRPTFLGAVMVKFFRCRALTVLCAASFFLVTVWFLLPSATPTDDEALFDLDLDVRGDASHLSSAETEDTLTIAISGGITSRGVTDVTDQSDFVAKFMFFHTFLPTFCSTACATFTYRFYFAFNFNDKVFADTQLADRFQRTFASQTKTLCLQPRGVKTSLNLVEVNYEIKPGWAQNDAMMEAYLDHVDYFYRINDDMQMITSGWASSFIRVLNDYDPPRVGVVGPNDQRTSYLTYEFVHRTHVDVFGFYYPRCFTECWADVWITNVYQPNSSTKVQDIRLKHTMTLGRRYDVVIDRTQELQREQHDGRLTLNKPVLEV